MVEVDKSQEEWLGLDELAAVLSRLPCARDVASASAASRALRQAAALCARAWGHATLAGAHEEEHEERGLVASGAPGPKLVALGGDGGGPQLAPWLAAALGRERLRFPTPLQSLAVGRALLGGGGELPPHVMCAVPRGCGRVVAACVAALGRADATQRKTQAVVSFAERDDARRAGLLLERLCAGSYPAPEVVCASDTSRQFLDGEWLDEHVVAGTAAKLASCVRRGNLRLWDAALVVVVGAAPLLPDEIAAPPYLVAAAFEQALRARRPLPQVMYIADAPPPSPKRRRAVERSLAVRGAPQRPVAWVAPG